MPTACLPDPGRRLLAATGSKVKLVFVLAPKNDDAQVDLTENFVLSVARDALKASIKTLAVSTMPALAGPTISLDFNPIWPKGQSPCAGLGELCDGAHPRCCKFPAIWPPTNDPSKGKIAGWDSSQFVCTTIVRGPPGKPGIPSPDGQKR